MKKRKIVTIGGGTGSHTVLRGLKHLPGLDITAIVAMADDGGSTGILRDEYGVLPPGDIRQCLIALSEESAALRSLFSYRFEGGSLDGHNAGNIIISALEKQTGDFGAGLDLLHKLLRVRGRVLPVTLSKCTLAVELGNGRVVRGEHFIDDLFSLSGMGVNKLWLENDGSPNPLALSAIREADLIVVGPGSLYTSILPNLLVAGIVPAIKKSRAKKVFVVNLMTKRGESDSFLPKDYLEAIERLSDFSSFDYILMNNGRPGQRILERYKNEGDLVVPDGKGIKKGKIVKRNLVSSEKVSKSPGDKIQRSLVRHDSDKLARALVALAD